jgi:hypothetical protein
MNASDEAILAHHKVAGRSSLEHRPASIEP